MGVWAWLKRFLAKEQTQPSRAGAQKDELVALVLLLRTPRHLDALRLADLAREVFGGHFAATQDDSLDQFLVGEEPSFMLKLGDRFFLVNCFDKPYLEDPEEAAEGISELRLRKAVREHTAWLSVDLLGECSALERPQIYRTIGKLTAALADDDCVAVFSPATSQLVVFDAEMCQDLRGENPLDLFEASPHPPVVPVSGDDPRLKAAVARVRRQWPKFVSAFEEREPEQSFSVKARIGDHESYEFMWLTVTGLENGMIYGRLDNDPIELTSISCGDRVRVPVKELNDWLYTTSEDVQGGFTIEVLRQIQQEMQRE